MVSIEIICKGRGQGKTYDLILESARTGVPILTAYNSKHVLDQAILIGAKILQPMTVKEYKYFKDNGSLLNSKNWKGKLLIDEVDGVLEQLLGVKVEKVTCTPDSMNEKEKNIMPTNFNYYENLLRGTYKVHIDKDRIKFPEIKDVNIIVPNKVVEVTFSDGTKEKSVCREPDTFSLESAISICISKKIMGGSSVYNNAVKRGMKVYDAKLEKEADEKAEQERIEKKCAKRLAYKKRRDARRTEEENLRKAREREEQIEIQKEAYLRAIKEIDNTNVEKTDEETIREFT